ncbi:MAG TPA: hypothetical protein VE641_15180 [Chthoniobacterales bacterium]|jgi:uncharacterized protein YjgD (DUF1641 family)|nr:hypothetical protein [Chthoniobacterales bacterium]
MAAPIKFESPRRSAHEELVERLERAPAEHAEALLAVYDLLQGIHDRGILDALNGALSSGNFILDTVVETANTPENIRAIRNLLILSKVLSDIDPDVLGSLAGAVPEALQVSSEKTSAPGMLSLLQKFNSRDSRRGMAFAASLLESLGKRLGEKKEG